MANYAAFLRGINVGGHMPVPMNKLKKALESLRFKNVQTLLASGNVVFEAPLTSAAALEQKIEDKLKKTFGHEIGVLVHTIEDLQRLSDSQPFKGIDVTSQTRLYVTFLSEQSKSSLKIPYISPHKSFRILRVSPRDVCSVLTLTPNSRTVDLMNVLEKEFGHKVTTRNWNTIVRVLEAHQT
jgi:uncharacterized protein (DUF1697 family)